MILKGKALKPSNVARQVMAAAIVAMVASQPALAAEDGADLETQYFNEVFADPSNLLLNFKLAGAQLENGNIKGAIATLERILALSPDNNQAQFLIASAHLQIGNTAEARRMFAILIQNPKATETEAKQAQSILAGLDMQARRFIVSGAVTAGMGLADNPEGGSIGNLSELSGVVQVGSASFTKRALTEEFSSASANINLQRKLESQNDESVILSLSTSGKDFAHYNAGDLATLGVTGRYMRTIESSIGKGTFNASLTSSRVHIDDKHYLNSYGANASYSQTIFGRWNANANLGINRSVFKKSFSASSSLKTARNITTGFRVIRAFERFQLGGKYNYAHSKAVARYNSKHTHSVGVFSSTNIIPGITSFGIDISQAVHKEGEIIYSDEKRQDYTQSANINYVLGLSSFTAPVGNEARVSVASKYGKTKSNIANYTKYSGEISMTFIKPF